MDCLSFLFSFTFLTPNHPPKEGNMFRHLVLALCATVFFFPAGCGVPISYDPCYTGTGCSQTGTAPADDGTTGDTDTTPPSAQSDCTELTNNAIAACGVGNVIVDCAHGLYYCQGNGSSGGDTTVVIYMTTTVNADGTTTVTFDDGDSSTPDCDDDIDNDADGTTDYPDDEDCSSESDTSEAGSGGDDGGDDGDDTGSGDCVESAGGIEYCDGVDNDCDGSIDNGDYDEDGYISSGCTAYDGLDPAGRSTGDCSDTNGYSGWVHSALIHPGQLELGDWIDEDCNGYDEDFTTETEVEFDGCMLQCNTDSSQPVVEFFETDSDVEIECASAFLVADDSLDANPLDESISFDYNGVTYSGVGVTCADPTVVQGNPAAWEDMDDIKSAMCALTPALSSATCLALF